MPNEHLNAYTTEQLSQEKIIPEKISSISHDIEAGERKRLEVMLENVETLTASLHEHTDEKFAFMGSIGLYLLLDELSQEREGVGELLILEQRIAGGKNDFDIGLSPESKSGVMQRDFGWDSEAVSIQRGRVGKGTQMVDVLERGETNNFPWMEVSIGKEKVFVQHPQEALFEKINALVEPGLDDEENPREREIKWGVDTKILKTYLMLSQNMTEQELERHLATRWEDFQFDRRYGNIHKLAQGLKDGTTAKDLLKPVIENRVGEEVSDLETALIDMFPQVPSNTIQEMLSAQNPDEFFVSMKEVIDTTLPPYRTYQEAQNEAAEHYNELLDA